MTAKTETVEAPEQAIEPKNTAKDTGRSKTIATSLSHEDYERVEEYRWDPKVRMTRAQVVERAVIEFLDRELS